MRFADGFLLMVEGVRSTQQLAQVVSVAKNEAIRTIEDYDTGKLQELHFSDGSVLWFGCESFRAKQMGVNVEVGQEWETLGMGNVTITGKTIDGDFYKFEGSNGFSYSPKGFAFPDHMNGADLYALVLS